MSSEQDAPVRYGEENGVVLDKWIFGVCGEDGLQFPAHRRLQFPAYLAHVKYVMKQKDFVAGTFNYPSRAGPREVLTLQYTLEALGNREKTYLKQLHDVEAGIDHVKATLEERTMGMSALPPSQMSRAPTPLPSSVGEQNAGYQSLPGSSSTAPPLRGDERRARYAEKKNIAARYMEKLRKDMVTTQAGQRDVVERHEKLKVEEDQLRKECAALKETEDIVLARQRETEASLATLRARVEDEVCAAAARHDGRAARLAAATAAVTTVIAPVSTPAPPPPPPQQQQQQQQQQKVTAPPASSPQSSISSPAPQEQTPEAVALLPSDDGEADAHTETADHAEVSDAAELVLGGGDGTGDAGSAVVISSTSSTSTASDKVHSDGEDHTTVVTGEGQEKRVMSNEELGAAVTDGEGDRQDEEETGPATVAPDALSDVAACSVSAESCAPPSPAPLPVTTTTTAEPVVTAEPIISEEARVARLERLRHELSEAGAQRQELLRSMRNEAQVHVGRMRQARQRLRDWQDVVEGQRRAADQLKGQVHVLTQVVEDTTARLEEAEVANNGGPSGGYAGHLARLNDLLRQRTVEQYQAYVGSHEGSAAEAATAAAAEAALLRPMVRPGPGASGSVTPARRGSSTSGATTPHRAGSEAAGSSGGSNRHRSRYDLVRHLQRWERALLDERARLRQAVGLNGASGATDGTVGRRDSYQKLRAMLLQSR